MGSGRLHLHGQGKVALARTHEVRGMTTTHTSSNFTPASFVFMFFQPADRGCEFERVVATAHSVAWSQGMNLKTFLQQFKHDYEDAQRTP